MSALRRFKSAITPKADIGRRTMHVRYGPLPNMRESRLRYARSRFPAQSGCRDSSRRRGAQGRLSGRISAPWRRTSSNLLPYFDEIALQASVSSSTCGARLLLSFPVRRIAVFSDEPFCVCDYRFLHRARHSSTDPSVFLLRSFQPSVNCDSFSHELMTGVFRPSTMTFPSPGRP
jgi:hypothetical protein